MTDVSIISITLIEAQENMYGDATRERAKTLALE
jgi:hypothetical protein